MARVRLHQVKPREQVGAPTGRKYEYQYELAALESLRLLTENDCVCVYCEWHDDFVVETGQSAVSYEFHQVKTRGLGQGPWTLANVFGLGPAKKVKTAAEDSIAHRLLEHRTNFGAACRALCFVTNNAINPAFSKFLTEVNAATKLPDDLGEAQRSDFERIVAAYKPRQISESDVIEFLRCFRVVGERPPWKTNVATYHAIADQVFAMSEVDLTRQQATQIGKELVDLVRIRSHVTLAQLPTSVAALRKAKGVCAEDVLGVLSLSPAGYRALRANGPDRVRSLSRLQRLCAASGVPDDLVPKICEFKSNWDTWNMAERENVEQLDLMTLRTECGELLTLHGAGRMDFAALAAACAELAKKYSRVPAVEQLTAELVMGHVFAIAAETGDW